MLRKYLIWAVAGLLTLAALAWLIVRNWLKSDDLSQDLRNRLIEWVDTKSNGSYQLELGSLVIDPDKATLTISDLALHPTDASPTDSVTHYRLAFEHLLVKNVDIAALLESSVLNLSSVTISGGELQIEQGKGTNALESAVDDATKEKPGRKKTIRAVKIDSILLSQLDIVYTNRKKSKTGVRSVHLDIYDFNSDSIQPGRLQSLGFRAFRLAIDSVHQDIAEKKYRIGASQLILKGEKEMQAVIRDAHLRPTSGQSLEALAAREPEQQDIYRASVTEVVIDAFDFQGFLEDSMIRTPLIVLKNPRLQIFNDRSLPPPTRSKIGRNPHQLIQKLPYGLEIPLIKVENGSVEYMEKNKDGTDVGKIRFQSIKGNAGPIYKGVREQGSLTLDLQSQLMGKVPLNAKFHFPPGNKGSFTVRASLAPFDLDILNPVVEPLAKVSLRSGRATALSINIRGNDRSATGDIKFLYEDLKADVLKEKEDGNTVKRPVVSLLANTILRSNNRADDRHANSYSVQQEREPTKSFFNLIWKTIFAGIKESAGVPEKSDKKKTDRKKSDRKKSGQ